MAKMTIEGVTYEGTPAELAEMVREFTTVAAESTETDKPAPAKEIEHNGETYTLVSRKAQAGDVVIPTGKTTSSYVRKDTPYVVGNRLDVEGFPVYKDGYNRTEANVLVYEKKAPALKVGDYVRVKDGAESRHGDIEAGEIVKVTHTDHAYPYKVRVDLLDGSDYDRFNADDLELVDEKDVQFAKIGRKTGEIKKGDVVKGYGIHVEREVHGIVKDVSGTLLGVLEFGQAYTAVEDFELIAPVESRVDSVGAGAFA